MARIDILARLSSVPAFFALRIASAIVLLKLSASLLPVSDYGEFAQLVQFGAVLNLVAVGGTQNGLIRQSAASQSEERLAEIHGAALIIWLCAALVLLVPLCFGSKLVSNVLVGRTDASAAVVAIATLSLTSGPGQIWCSILSGRKRVTASLAAQAAGLLAGTVLAALFVVRGEPNAAAIGFAAGPLVTMAISGSIVAGLRLRIAGALKAKAQILPLIHYSAALAATTGYAALVLFGLRSLYRQDFGADALGYWIAANRVSDMSTQLIGLFMIQFFVSHVANLTEERERRRFVLRCWTVGASVMALVLLTFTAGAPRLVPLFLSDAFLPAVPVIRTYMIGDVMRVWASLAMFSAFAAGRPGRYAAIEMSTLTLMGVIAVVLMKAGDARAPQLAYASAYSVVALIVTAGFFRTPISARLSALFRRRGARRTPRRGSAARLHALAPEPQGRLQPAPRRA